MSKRYRRVTKVQAVQKLEPHRGSVILTERVPAMPGAMAMRRETAQTLARMFMLPSALLGRR